jgi:hypothetical protein
VPTEPRPRKRKVAAEPPAPERQTKRARVSIPRGGKAHSKQDTDPDSRPQNVRIRLGKRWSQIVTEVKAGQYTWEEFVEELGPDELARAQLKNEQGGFGGRPPEMVPRAFVTACTAEIHRRFNEKLKDRLLDATEDLINLSRNGRLDGKDQAKVLIYLLERVMGPVPKTVVIAGADEPWQNLMAAGFMRPAVDKSEAPASPPPRSHDRYSKRRKQIDAAEDVDD